MTNLSSYNESLYVQNLMNEERNRILIWSSSNGKSLEGFIDAEVSLSTNVQWGNEIVGSKFDDFGSSVTKTFTNQRIKPQILSRVTWTASSLNALSFDIYVPTITRGDNHINMAKNIFDFTLSEQISSRMVYTPNKYNVNPKGDQEGLLSVKIGYWFYSSESWVMSSASLTRSKESIEGSIEPLWVKVSCVLTPARDFYASDVKGWFL